MTELIRVIPLSLRSGATLVLDQFGSPVTARSEIRRVLRLRDIEPGFRRIQVARSRSEPLVQVADLVAGALTCRMRGDDGLFRLIAHRYRRIVEYEG